MKWIAGLLAVAAAYFYGVHVGDSRTRPETEIAHLTNERFRDYQSLKDDKRKFDKANEILATILQLFIADLGLERSSKQLCTLNHSAEFVPPPQQVVYDTQAPPKPDPPARPPRPKADDGKGKNGKINALGGVAGAAGFNQANAKGAAHALYQAILWRNPDVKEESEATNAIMANGWPLFVQHGRRLIQSTEFLKQVEPSHTPQQIINRMYAVFVGRCAFAEEMKRQLDTLSNKGPVEVVTEILGLARHSHPDQIFAGGFPVNSCENN